MFGLGRKGRRTINLALQGGGAHGAFTWGVLDRLLDEADLDIGWVSATSAGAVNAVALAAGLAEGGRPSARDKLRAVWDAVHEAGVPDLLRINPFLYGMTRASSLPALLSPYQFNPLGFDPLRRLLTEHIDFDKVRAFDGIELLIAATDVATGAKRLFRRSELTVESVLASACLPTLHHAVEIEGRAYWDGGFSANPDLVTLAAESPCPDTLLVQLTPFERSGIPRGARQIAGEVNRITFNQPLRRDIEMIAALREDSASRWRKPQGHGGRIARHRFHLIDAGRHTASLPPETKLRPDRGLFAYLHGSARTETHKWLAQHGSDIGRRETADLPAMLKRSTSFAVEMPAEADDLDEPNEPPRTGSGSP